MLWHGYTTECTMLQIYENLGLRVAEWLLHVLHTSVKNYLLTLAEIQHELLSFSLCLFFNLFYVFFLAVAICISLCLFLFCLYAVTFSQICVYL